MTLPTLTTTPELVFATKTPKNFTFIADNANSTNIRVSTVDATVADSFDTLAAGEELEFEDFIGNVYARSVSGTPSYAIDFVYPLSENERTEMLKGRRR